MALHIAQKGGTQLTAPQKNSAVFTQMEYADPQRNTFNLSKQTHGSMQMGKLYPVYSRMVFPGDSFEIEPSHFIRFASVLSPILNRISITYSAFYVPFRLVWKFFPTFISGGYNNDGVYTDESGNYLDQHDQYTTTPFTPKIPRIDMLARESGSHVVDGVDIPNFIYNFFDGGLADWLGYPSFPENWDYSEGITSSNFQEYVNALPFMCYQKIINDWYTNPNIKDVQRPQAVPPTNCSDTFTNTAYFPQLTSLAYVNYGLDYFTSCLPYLQRGDAITLGSEGGDQIEFNPERSSRVQNTFITSTDGTQLSPDEEMQLMVNTSGELYVYNKSTSNEELALINNANSLSVQYSTTIQELRYLNALQKFCEKSLRVGTRYIDFLKCYFGVNASDKSLQRSEYLGSSVDDVTKLDVDQTSATNYNSSSETTPLGTVACKMLASGKAKKFKCYCEEHGMIIVLASITPETIYKNRMRTEYIYSDKEDFLFPEFTHLSPQAVKGMELFVPRSKDESTNYNGFTTFGYQDRYNELRCDTNDVHGDFKNSLSFFLQMRNFTNQPSLNTSFLKADDIDSSIFATNKVQDANGTFYEVDTIWASFNFDVKAVRCLPKIATPQLV